MYFTEQQTIPSQWRMLIFGGKYMIILRMTNGRLLSFTTNKPQELSSFLQNLPDGAPHVKIEV
ncbi:MAG: hypothetical protein WC865_12785 [Bacteroidales bacterium]